MKTTLSLLALSMAGLAAAQNQPSDYEQWCPFPRNNVPYPCYKMHLTKSMTLAELGCGAGHGSDIWGWTDKETGDEFAIMTCTTVTSFVDITDPFNPVVRAILPSPGVGGYSNPLARDVKVFKDHAYIVSDWQHAGQVAAAPAESGVQIVDLKSIVGLAANTVISAPDTPDSLINEVFAPSHNLAVNEETNRMYALRACPGDRTMMLDVSDPMNPIKLGCLEDSTSAHDMQSIVYHGPTEEFQGREIVILYDRNPEELRFLDVTDPEDVFTVSTVTYPNGAISHQGWATVDHRYVLMGDEGDEAITGTDCNDGTCRTNARTLIFDIEDLLEPKYVGFWDTPEDSVDHNVYVSGNHAFLANYQAGLRVLNLDFIDQGHVYEEAWFDPSLAQASTSVLVPGAWSSYPYFPSGHVVVSVIEAGLFILQPDESITHDGTYDENFVIPVADDADADAEGSAEASSLSAQAASTCSQDGVVLSKGGIAGISGAFVVTLGAAVAATALVMQKRNAHKDNMDHMQTV